MKGAKVKVMCHRRTQYYDHWLGVDVDWHTGYQTIDWNRLTLWLWLELEARGKEEDIGSAPRTQRSHQTVNKQIPLSKRSHWPKLSSLETEIEVEIELIGYGLKRRGNQRLSEASGEVDLFIFIFILFYFIWKLVHWKACGTKWYHKS